MTSATDNETRSEKAPRVLIVAEHASALFGGEAILPLHYFRILRQRGVDVWLISHERTRAELEALLADDVDRLQFIPDTWLNRLAWRIGGWLPAKMAYVTVGYASRLATQLVARRIARRMVREKAIEIVHQPIPVSPREPSLLHDMGASVVIGPMNGNMTYPPGFLREKTSLWSAGALLVVVRYGTTFLHRLMPGKPRAAALIVANERTRVALPCGTGKVVSLVENGVDLDLWHPCTERRREEHGRLKLIYIGRMVDWKAVDILLEALICLGPDAPVELELIGDGPMRASLEALAGHPNLRNRVRFLGWKSQRECAEALQHSDAMVLPSLYECGGAVVLEAMACGVPVIATDWGGPADYLDASCGILVAPESREKLTAGIAEAIARLASDGAFRSRLGQAGAQRAACFDWQAKVDAMLKIYASVLDTREGAGRRVGLADRQPPTAESPKGLPWVAQFDQCEKDP